jgi:hypothetical protein
MTADNDKMAASRALRRALDKCQAAGLHVYMMESRLYLYDDASHAAILRDPECAGDQQEIDSIGHPALGDAGGW